MPVVTTFRTKRTAGFTFTWSDKNKRAIAVPLPNTPITGEATALVAFRAAMSNITNSCITAQRVNSELEALNPTEIEVFDESYGLSVSLVLVFRDANSKLLNVEIPAPDESFVVDGALNINDALITSAVTTYQALYASGSAPVLQRGYIATRKVDRITSGVFSPSATEPTASQNPPPDPGV